MIELMIIFCYINIAILHYAYVSVTFDFCNVNSDEEVLFKLLLSLFFPVGVFITTAFWLVPIYKYAMDKLVKRYATKLKL